jgi:hypothetical protein
MRTHHRFIELTVVLTALGAAALEVSGCGNTGPAPVSYPVYATGDALAAQGFVVGNWTVTLQVAQVGFGPAYFCATASASGDLCPAAVEEFHDVATVDALDPSPQLLGNRSYWGISRGTPVNSCRLRTTLRSTGRPPTPGPLWPTARPLAIQLILKGLLSKATSNFTLSPTSISHRMILDHGPYRDHA